MRHRLSHHVSSLSNGSWGTIQRNTSLSLLSSAQKDHFQSMLERKSVRRGQRLWVRGQPIDRMVLIQSGVFIFEEVHGKLESFLQGAQAER